MLAALAGIALAGLVLWLGRRVHRARQARAELARRQAARSW